MAKLIYTFLLKQGSLIFTNFIFRTFFLKWKIQMLASHFVAIPCIRDLSSCRFYAILDINSYKWPIWGTVIRRPDVEVINTAASKL